MNYYPFHIGDYHAHTAHLDDLRDLAYRRLLDRYYLTEAALVGAVEDIADKIRFGDTPERVRVVERVLREFFQNEDGMGWRHGRADEEIERMREKQEVVEQRDQHEKTRLQKHREQRAAMFQALADIGVFLPYNTKMSDLRLQVAQHLGPLETHSLSNGETGLETGLETPETLLATASRGRVPTPTPTPTPTPKEEIQDHLSVIPSRAAAQAADLLGDQIEPTETPKSIAAACPHREILALWAEHMPDCVQHDPERWKGARASHLRARWRETAMAKGWTQRQQGLAYFRKLMGYCRQSPFLMGKVPPPPGRRRFELELAWLVNDENWTKVHEGRYHETTGI